MPGRQGLGSPYVFFMGEGSLVADFASAPMKTFKTFKLSFGGQVGWAPGTPGSETFLHSERIQMSFEPKEEPCAASGRSITP